MILITGATGHLGGLVVDFLLKRRHAAGISVMARDPGRAKELHVAIRPGDYNEYGSLLTAFKGVDQLYFISASDVTRRELQHMNVVKAAAEAGVRHVIYTSFQRKKDNPDSPIAFVTKAHIDTEAAIINAGFLYTILRHNLYLDYVPIYIGEHVIERGVIYQPAGKGKVAYAARNDMAEAGVNVLTSPGHENKTYDFSNTRSWSYSDIAKILTEVSGKKITHVSPTAAEFKTSMLHEGLPDEVVDSAAAFALAIKAGEFDTPGTELEKLLGHAPVSAEEYLRGVYGK
ncbi:SDR family oxidoreductase [Chitinophaga barathri]|nr:SDR family oxidoreductase [Chitinophaga barathri]